MHPARFLDVSMVTCASRAATDSPRRVTAPTARGAEPVTPLYWYLPPAPVDTCTRQGVSPGTSQPTPGGQWPRHQRHWWSHCLAPQGHQLPFHGPGIVPWRIRPRLGISGWLEGA